MVYMLINDTEFWWMNMRQMLGVKGDVLPRYTIR